MKKLKYFFNLLIILGIFTGISFLTSCKNSGDLPLPGYSVYVKGEYKDPTILETECLVVALYEGEYTSYPKVPPTGAVAGTPGETTISDYIKYISDQTQKLTISSDNLGKKYTIIFAKSEIASPYNCRYPKTGSIIYKTFTLTASNPNTITIESDDPDWTETVCAPVTVGTKTIVVCQ